MVKDIWQIKIDESSFSAIKDSKFINCFGKDASTLNIKNSQLKIWDTLKDPQNYVNNQGDTTIRL